MLRQRLMLRWTSLFTNRLPKGVRRKQRMASVLTRRLAVEALEDRRMLSTVVLGSGNEPFVVVDPFNPLNVVVGGNELGAVFSTDGAETFGSASVPAGYRGDPGLAIDSTGNVFFSYLINDSADPMNLLDIAVSNTTFTAQNFGVNQVVISNGNQSDDKELIAADYFTTSPFRDNIYVAWQEMSPEGVRYTSSTDGGVSFGASQVLTTPANNFTSGADPEVGPNGEVYIAYWDGSNIGGDVGEIRLLKSTDGGVNFFNPVAGGAGISAAPGTIGLDATGLDHNAILVGNQAPNQNFRWNVRTMIDIEADPLRNGNVYSIWLTDPDGTTAGDAANVMFSRSVDAGVNWSTPTVLNDDGGSLTQHMPSIAVDEAGNLVAIWYDERLSPNVNDPNLAIFGSASLDGGATWSPNFLLDDSTFDPDSGGANTFIGDYIQVAAADGTAYATWTQTNIAGTNQIHIEKFSILAAFADQFEPNNSLTNATVLGSLSAITLQDLTIHDEDDEDWFKITANNTGKLIINVFFDDEIGDLDVQVVDANGNVIASATTTTDNEQLVVPVVSQEMYFVSVRGFNDATNSYDLEIENFPAPIPEMPVLHPDDDNGISGTDNITGVEDPRIFIQADLADFAAMGINILDAAQATGGVTNGAAVEVFINGVSQGFADPVGSSNTLFQFQLDSDVLALGLPVQGGTLNFITAAVRIFDGQRDGAGMPSPASGRTSLSKPLELITADVEGPRVNDVRIFNFPDYDLFDPKPSEDGPTPPITQLVIEFIDFPERDLIFVDGAVDTNLAENEALYSVFGDATGNIPIQSAQVIASSVTVGAPASATVLLTFFEPLLDDRFTLTVFDDITDPSGNLLDGESNAVQPLENPTFASGDGIPGGDFVARFTVDSRAEIGTWAAGSVLIDTNGNFIFDSTNTDFTNRDLTYRIGFDSDYVFAGKFSVRQVATGFDTIAAYGRVNGNQFRWLIDTDDNGVVDLISFEPVGAGINGYPVAGNFDGNPLNGDEVGLFDGQFWYLDTDHDFNVSDETPIPAIDYSGFPIVGDFDGDGDDDVATYIASSAGGNLFSVDLNQALPGNPILIDGVADFSFQVGFPNTGGFGFAGVRERPVAADFNADGIDDFGLWVPDGIVPVPNELSEWYLLLSGDDPFTVNFEVSVLDRIQEGPLNGFVPFSPEPFGNDLYAQFGNTFSLPIVGNFDPPVVSGPSSFVSQALTSLPISVPEVITPTIEQTETQPVLEELSKPVVSTLAAVEQPVEEEVVIVVVQVSTEESVETELALATETEPVQSSLHEAVTAIVEAEVATPESLEEVVAKQVPAEPEPKVVAASESVVVKVTTEAPTEEIPVALVDPTVPTQSRSRVRSLSFGGSHTVASVSTPSVPPPVVKPAEPQLPVAVEIVVETPTSEEVFQAPVVEIATDLSTSNLLTSGTTKSIPNKTTTPVTLVLTPDPIEVVGEDAGNPGSPALRVPTFPVSEQSKGDETDLLSQDTATDLNVLPSTSRSRTRTLIYVQGQNNDRTSPQTPRLAAGNTADTEQLAYLDDLTNDGVDPTQEKTAMTDAAFDNASQFEFNRVDAEVVDELSRLNQNLTEEFGSRI